MNNSVSVSLDLPVIYHVYTVESIVFLCLFVTFIKRITDCVASQIR